MAASEQHHVEGLFRLHDSRQAVESGYRPQHKVHDNYLTTGRHEYPEVEQVAPGDTVQVHAWFVTPEVYPGSLWVGREIDVMEGQQIVGKLTITRILNEVLAGSAYTYKPLWTAPPSSVVANASKNYIAAFFIGGVYLITAGAALALAMQAYTPCESNFEGGCSIGRALLALASLVCAAVAALTSLGVKGALASFPLTKPHAKTAAIVLGGVPIAYVLFTLYAAFLH